MKKLLTTILILIAYTAIAQTEINEALRIELSKIDKDDQDLRRIYFVQDIYQSKSDSLKKEYEVDDAGLKKILAKKITRNDSLNLIKIESIITTYGYPGKSLVGYNESGVAWQVIQHSSPEIMKKYLDVLKKAADEGEVDFTKYALTLDRILMSENKPQIYGSQAKYVNLVGKEEPQLIIWPIEDAKNINRLRRKVGFGESIKKYAKKMRIKYRTYSMEDIE